MKTRLSDTPGRGSAGWVVALVAAFLAACAPAPTARQGDLAMPATSPFPESVSVAADGTMFVSSISHGGVVKFEPGSSAPVAFVKPGEHDTRSTFGVFADDRRALLWVASNDASAIGLKGPSAVEGGWIRAFDLRTGAPKASFRLPTPGIANDVAIAQDGSLYVTNTAAPQILRLKPGAAALEVVVQDDALKGGLDGIAFGQDGHLYVNTFVAGELFRVEMNAGEPGKVTKLRTSRPLVQPDALRPFKGGFLMVEGGGTLDRITIDGDVARIDTLANVDGPTGLWLAKDRMWITEGQLAYLTDPSKRGTLPASFKVRAIPLP